MKLSQLYADKNFKNIVFNDGLNLILAKVTRKLDLNKDSHNLGKTTLIAVLDFMLLSSLYDEHIFKKYQETFAGYTFYLEVLLNKGNYLTIKRGVDIPTRISFKTTESSSFLQKEIIWEKHDLDQTAAEIALNEYLNFDVLENWEYRKSVTYFLRSQKDYNDVFQLEKFAKGKAMYWKPFIFDLLGFDGKLLEEKYKTDDEISQQKNFIGKIKHQFAVGY